MLSSAAQQICLIMPITYQLLFSLHASFLLSTYQQDLYTNRGGLKKKKKKRKNPISSNVDVDLFLTLPQYIPMKVSKMNSITSVYFTANNEENKILTTFPSYNPLFFRYPITSVFHDIPEKGPRSITFLHKYPNLAFVGLTMNQMARQHKFLHSACFSVISG